MVKHLQKMILAAVTLLASNGVCAYDFISGGICYNILSNSTVEVTYMNTNYNSYSGTISIPSSVTRNGQTYYTVAKIGDNAFYKCKNLDSVVMPNSIVTIGVSAFQRCTRLKSIIIPNSVYTISASAFKGDSSLTYVYIPNSVHNIGDHAFNNCINLDSITIPNSVCSIGPYAFDNCRNLDSITIPSSVYSIGQNAFTNCINLVYISIPNTITEIKDGTFSGCGRLASINIPKSVRVIGACSFTSCISLTSIIIPDSVWFIRNDAFNNCINLSSITIPKSVVNIDHDAFAYDTALRSITFYRSNTDILDSTVFGHGVTTNIPIYVPCGATSWYRSELNTFSNFVEFVPYHYTAVAQDTTMGQVTIDTIPTCNNNSTLVINAIANNGYTFSHWSDRDTNTQRTITITQDTNLIAYFTQIPVPWYNFEVMSEDTAKGTVQVVTQPTQENPLAIIVALPNAGYSFSRWSDGNTQNPRALTVTQDTILIAFFTSNQGIAEAENDNISILTANGNILLEGVSNERVFVTDVLGRVIYNAIVKETAEIAVRNRGVYFVKVGNHPARKVVVVR